MRGIASGVARLLGRSAYTLLLVVLLVVTGKAAQYAAVDRLGPDIGFVAASLVALVPFVTLLVVARRRWPRLLAARGTWRR